MTNSANSAGRATRESNTRPLNRFEITKRMVAKLTQGEAVIGGIGNTNFDLWCSGQRPENFYMLGSMGLAIPIALGVALAQPSRKVIALEGDGSLLMQLGCLSTVAIRAPRNLIIIVMDNGIYQITGAQQTATAASVDLVAVARACGLAASHWAADEADFDALFDAAQERAAPSLIALRIDDQAAVGQTEREPARIRDQFMRGIGAKGNRPVTQSPSNKI
ncbi:thiamine pyrophosphate-dependent enzyme [Bradyrhizobium sp. LHD-71]|uniref:thiamine pyrophosphate-dependent enzyme n=1 Tax=Bradyrhizobium sp. LHD-71 TaxID=3072141 RepID=UPI00281057D6|nr:thiamine pyrophosphate-dependent enzyme [Bradyrhizobium sp. LHD-71]MDQ8729210.1 thiamine pyrophosphate-dependent enzyme [Bradyrhizobium sp. LHD-71]